MIDTANLSRSLVYHTEDLLDYLAGLIDRGEQLEFAVHLLGGMLGQNLPLYFTEDIPYFHALLEMKGRLREKGLELLEKKVSRLIGLYLETGVPRREIYYLLARYLPETESSFRFHIQFTALTLQNLEKGFLVRLSRQASCRHDISGLARRCAGDFSCEGRAPYKALFEKMARRLETPDPKEASYLRAYILLTDLFRLTKVPQGFSPDPEEAEKAFRESLAPLALENPESILAYMKSKARERPPVPAGKIGSGNYLIEKQSLTKGLIID